MLARDATSSSPPRAALRSELLAECPGVLRRTFTVLEFAALLDHVDAADPVELVGGSARRTARTSAGIDQDVPDPYRRGARSPRARGRADRTTRWSRSPTGWRPVTRREPARHGRAARAVLALLVGLAWSLGAVPAGDRTGAGRRTRVHRPDHPRLGRTRSPRRRGRGPATGPPRCRSPASGSPSTRGTSSATTTSRRQIRRPGRRRRLPQGRATPPAPPPTAATPRRR